MLELFHFWSSTCSRKVRFTLAEKGLNWRSHHIDIVEKLENLEPEYIKLNPNGVVPTLRHNGNIITESNIIIEYLDDAFPHVPLSPEDHYLRSLMRLWLDTAETQVHKNINIISYNKRHVPRMKKLFTKKEQREILMRFPGAEKRAIMLKRMETGVSIDDEKFAIDRLIDVMDRMEGVLSTTSWIAGETFSLADIAIAPFVERFEANDIGVLVDWKKRRRCGDWWQRIQSRPSYQEAFSFKNPNV